jgi:hypothetical protein
MYPTQDPSDLSNLSCIACAEDTEDKFHISLLSQMEVRHLLTYILIYSVHGSVLCTFACPNT